jgi:tetraacyldisaccharide 4'-kinase
VSWDPRWVFDVMSGRRRTFSAALLRAGLAVLEPVYYLGIQWRNRNFDCGKGVAEPVGVPVISIGNITTGGTGKTPVVEWVACQLRESHRRVTIISRGYGAEVGAMNDEAMELERSLPDVPHLQNPDRVEAARIAIDELDCECILLDDAFQHRRIHRDIDVVLLDALEPFGFGHLLPRGLLREPLSNLSRAHWVGLSRADQVTEQTRLDIREQVKRLAPQAGWFEVAHRPVGWENFAGETSDLSEFNGRPVFAFCGIGNPEGFRRSLQDLPLELVDFHAFPDHHPYSRDDVDWLKNWVAGHPDAVLICTRKDLVKLGIDSIAAVPLWGLRIGIEFLLGGDEFANAIRAIV